VAYFALMNSEAPITFDVISITAARWWWCVCVCVCVCGSLSWGGVHFWKVLTHDSAGQIHQCTAPLGGLPQRNGRVAACDEARII
jgi:hypothetical protein